MMTPRRGKRSRRVPHLTDVTPSDFGKNISFSGRTNITKNLMQLDKTSATHQRINVSP